MYELTLFATEAMLQTEELLLASELLSTQILHIFILSDMVWYQMKTLAVAANRFHKILTVWDQHFMESIGCDGKLSTLIVG